MTIDPAPTHESLVQRYLAAMRQGPAAEDEMLSLFSEDAVYSDPFGPAEPAVGIDAIRARLRSGWENAPPDLELDVKAIVVNGDRAFSDWECRSPVFEAPVTGRDDYRFRDGLIVELVVTIVE